MRTAIAGARKKGSRIRLTRGSKSTKTTIPSPPNTGGGTLVKGGATIVAAFGSASKDDWREQLNGCNAFLSSASGTMFLGPFPHYQQLTSSFSFWLRAWSLPLCPQTFAG